jgi:hypothetical protein
MASQTMLSGVVVSFERCVDDNSCTHNIYDSIEICTNRRIAHGNYRFAKNELHEAPHHILVVLLVILFKPRHKHEAMEKRGGTRRDYRFTFTQVMLTT